MYTKKMSDGLIVHRVEHDDLIQDRLETPWITMGNLNCIVSCLHGAKYRKIEAVEWITTEDEKLTDFTIYFSDKGETK